jgi:hypothetical protein
LEALVREWPAIGVAVLVTPLIPGACMGLVLTTSDPKQWGLGLLMPLVGYQFSFLIAAVLGLPLFLLLRQLNWLRSWVALLLGFPFGFAVGHFLFPRPQPLWSPGLLGAIGSLTSWVFWFTWRRLTTQYTLTEKIP